MTRVQHDQVKPDMTIKLANHGPSGRWITVRRVIEVRPSSAQQAACSYVAMSYLNGKDKDKTFQVFLYEREDGYEVHPKSELLAAQAHQRNGRADVVNIVLREYSIKLAIVDSVDNEGEPCGYCSGANEITTNIYATVFSERNFGAPEESAWSACTPCTMYSIDQVEDVDPSHTITIERA